MRGDNWTKDHAYWITQKFEGILSKLNLYKLWITRYKEEYDCVLLSLFYILHF